MGDCHVGIHFWNTGPRSIGMQRLTTESPTILPKSLLLHHESLWPYVPGSKKHPVAEILQIKFVNLDIKVFVFCFFFFFFFLKQVNDFLNLWGIPYPYNETNCLNKSSLERLKLCKDDYSQACNLDCHFWLEWRPL